jgi:hypothetical protein
MIQLTPPVQPLAPVPAAVVVFDDEFFKDTFNDLIDKVVDGTVATTKPITTKD